MSVNENLTLGRVLKDTLDAINKHLAAKGLPGDPLTFAAGDLVMKFLPVTNAYIRRRAGVEGWFILQQDRIHPDTIPEILKRIDDAIAKKANAQ